MQDVGGNGPIVPVAEQLLEQRNLLHDPFVGRLPGAQAESVDDMVITLQQDTLAVPFVIVGDRIDGRDFSE